MNCQNTQKTKDLITIGVFGRLTPDQERELKEHLKTCPECAELYARSEHLVGLNGEIEDIPLPDAEQNWQAVAARISGRHGQRRFVPVPKWALAACSLLLVFVLGYFIGTRVLDSGPQPAALSGTEMKETSFLAYADLLKPVLVNFLNRDGVETPEELQILERRIISDMLYQTRLLKSLASRRPDPDLAELLQDLEFILTAMDNLKPEDRNTARHLARMIREKKVSLRLQELITSKTTI
jgi:hypothetical protein